MAKVFALDQNFLRSSDLETLIVTNPTAKFVLPDVAFLEMAKTAEWWDTMRRSLAILGRRPDRILASISVSEALQYERETLECVQPYMVCKQATQWTRDLVRDLAANDPTGAGVARLTPVLASVQHDLLLAELNHEDNLNRLKISVQRTKSLLGPAGVKALRRPDCSAVERLAVVYYLASVFARDFLISHGHSAARVSKFLKRNPFLFRYYLVLIRHYVEWVRVGGIENLTPEKATNDILDQHYVVAGSFFDGLLTRETTVKQADKELRFMLSIKNPGGIPMPTNKLQ